MRGENIKHSPLIVCFSLQGESPTSPVMPRTQLMIRSVRKFIPEAKIIQLSNMDFPEAEGVDEVIRRPNNGDFIEWGYGSFIELLERGQNVLQIATDILITKDVSEVWEQGFDIAACRYSFKDRRDGAFCGDVNFCRPSSIDAWKDALEIYSRDFRDGWFGGEHALLEVYRRNRYNFLPIDFDKYCYTPNYLNEDISGASILHFRGPRKPMMDVYASNLLD